MSHAPAHRALRGGAKYIRDGTARRRLVRRHWRQLSNAECDRQGRRRISSVKSPRLFAFATAAVLFNLIARMSADELPADRVRRIQAALSAAKLDGWLFYDFRGSD